MKYFMYGQRIVADGHSIVMRIDTFDVKLRSLF